MKIGHGLFSRAESYQLFTAEHDGYIYTLQDEKNFNRQRGYRIEIGCQESFEADV